MLRAFVCAVLGMALVSSVGLAGQKQKKKGGSVTGTIKKIDATEGTLTVTVKAKKVVSDQKFKVTADTKIVVGTDTEKKELVGISGLKSDQLKEGAVVTVTPDESDKTKAKEVRLGGGKKKKKDK
jgi:hypothetical protein